MVWKQPEVDSLETNKTITAPFNKRHLCHQINPGQKSSNFWFFELKRETKYLLKLNLYLYFFYHVCNQNLRMKWIRKFNGCKETIRQQFCLSTNQNRGHYAKLSAPPGYIPHHAPSIGGNWKRKYWKPTLIGVLKAAFHVYVHKIWKTRNKSIRLCSVLEPAEWVY